MTSTTYSLRVLTQEKGGSYVDSGEKALWPRADCCVRYAYRWSLSNLHSYNVKLSLCLGDLSCLDLFCIAIMEHHRMVCL